MFKKFLFCTSALVSIFSLVNFKIEAQEQFQLAPQYHQTPIIAHNSSQPITGNGGTTGWNQTSSTSEQSCLQKAIQTMNFLVDQGDIQTLPNGNSWRFRQGNNVIFSVFCTKSGSHVRVDVICFNACDRSTFALRERIDALMQW